MLLENKNAVVYGGSGSIGGAVARVFAREGANLDFSWTRNKSLEASADLEDPDIIAEEIADDLEVALEQFAAIAVDLRSDRN